MLQALTLKASDKKPVMLAPMWARRLSLCIPPLWLGPLIFITAFRPPSLARGQGLRTIC